jgi:hypothetical protein
MPASGACETPIRVCADVRVLWTDTARSTRGGGGAEVKYNRGQELRAVAACAGFTGAIVVLRVHCGLSFLIRHESPAARRPRRTYRVRAMSLKSESLGRTDGAKVWDGEQRTDRMRGMARVCQWPGIATRC